MAFRPFSSSIFETLRWNQVHQLPRTPILIYLDLSSADLDQSGTVSPNSEIRWLVGVGSVHGTASALCQYRASENSYQSSYTDLIQQEGNTSAPKFRSQPSRSGFAWLATDIDHILLSRTCCLESF